MIDVPIVFLVVPDSDGLILLILFGRNEVFDDEVLQFQLVRQLVDRVEHVISFSIKVLLARVQRILRFVVRLPDRLQLLALEIQLVLNIVEFMLRVEEIVLLLGELFLKLSLLLLLFLEFFARLLQFLSLLFCHLYGLRPDYHFFLHLF